MSRFTKLDYSKLSEAFSEISITKNGNVFIDANIAGDARKNSVAFELYADENGFYWRRQVMSLWLEGYVRHYQLFRTYIAKTSSYKWKHFSTVDEAINKLKVYLAKF